MPYPSNYRYTREHEWIELNGAIAPSASQTMHRTLWATCVCGRAQGGRRGHRPDHETQNRPTTIVAAHKIEQDAMMP